MIQINAVSANDAYLKAAVLLKQNALTVTGRQQGTLHEIRNIAIEIAEPRKCVVSVPWRNLSYKYAAAEFALFSAMNTNVEAYAHYAKKWKELDVDGTVCSAYGERMFSNKRDPISVSRFSYALDQLLSNKESKNAVIMMRDWTDNRPTHQKDRCCTLFVQFSIRDDRLDMTVYMRSSDFWYGLPYDIFWYSTVMQRMLYLYNARSGLSPVTLGAYTHICTSLHLYEAQYNRVPINKIHHDPSLDFVFPEWDEAAENEVLAFTYFENVLRTYEGADVQGMVKKFSSFMETMGSLLVNQIKTREASFYDKAYLSTAEDAASCSICVDKKVGCVLVCENGETVVTFNEVISCDKNCADKRNRKCSVDHAEVSAVCLAKKQNKHPVTAYVTLCPCYECSLVLRAAGIENIIVKGFSHKGGVGKLTLLDPAFF